MNLSKNVKVACVKAGQAAGTTAVNSDAIDMTNYDGCLFFASIATANAGNYLVVEQSDDITFATKSVLEGTKVVTANDGEVALVDVYRPLEKQGKYLRASIVRTASTATGCIYAIQYDGRVKPEDIGALAISPGASV